MNMHGRFCADAAPAVHKAAYYQHAADWPQACSAPRSTLRPAMRVAVSAAAVGHGRRPQRAAQRPARLPGQRCGPLRTRLSRNPCAQQQRPLHCCAELLRAEATVWRQFCIHARKALVTLRNPWWLNADLNHTAASIRSTPTTARGFKFKASASANGVAWLASVSICATQRSTQSRSALGNCWRVRL